MGLTVLSPGLLTTVQDAGRHGYQRYGVAVAGAMDLFALQAGNLLLGNDPTEAGLELTLVGPTLRFDSAALIALTGADLGARIDGVSVPGWQQVRVEPGAVLSFGEARHGCRQYLLVAGGLALAPVLGSRASHARSGLGGLGDGQPLRAGDHLEFRRPIPAGTIAMFVRLPSPPTYSQEVSVRVLPGPQADRFSEDSLSQFCRGQYLVSESSDRMGYRLKGQAIEHLDSADVVSEGIAIGSVQVPGDGMPIIMLADRQTTGGYTKIATVISADLPVLAQLVPGVGRLSFDIVDQQTALMARRERYTDLARLAGAAAYDCGRLMQLAGDAQMRESEED